MSNSIEERSDISNPTQIKKEENRVVFITQIILIYVVVISAIVNLSVGSELQSLWISLLSSCLGYLLPTPKIKSKSI